VSASLRQSLNARLPSPLSASLLFRCCLSACLLARSCAADCSSSASQLSTSITTAGPSEDSWSTRFSQPPACAQHRPPASLPCPAWLCVGSHLPRENPLPPPHSDRHSRTSSHSQDCCVARPGTDSTPRRSLHQPARAVISYPSHPLSACHLRIAACDSARPRRICDSLGSITLRLRRQHFACGRPIHLATSSPNDRAETSTLLHSR
jgi:hypothetical protein